MAKNKSSFFARYVDDLPSIEKKQEPSPAQKLLDWLQHWAEPTITARDIRVYGPRAVRSREGSITAAETLAGHGWLIPIETRVRIKTKKYAMYEWRIVRKPLLSPDVAHVADQPPAAAQAI
jgi:hypothetical protein